MVDFSGLIQRFIRHGLNTPKPRSRINPDERRSSQPAARTAIDLNCERANFRYCDIEGSAESCPTFLRPTLAENLTFRQAITPRLRAFQNERARKLKLLPLAC